MYKNLLFTIAIVLGLGFSSLQAQKKIGKALCTCVDQQMLQLGIDPEAILDSLGVILNLSEKANAKQKQARHQEFFAQLQTGGIRPEIDIGETKAVPEDELELPDCLQAVKEKYAKKLKSGSAATYFFMVIEPMLTKEEGNIGDMMKGIKGVLHAKKYDSNLAERLIILMFLGASSSSEVEMPAER